MNKTILQNYAKLIVQIGANVQSGQEVVLITELDQPEFVKILVDECYKAGAKRVVVEWNHTMLQKIHAEYQSLSVLSETTPWEMAKFEYLKDVFPVRIILESSDPDGLNGIKQPEYSEAIQARNRIYRPYREAIEGHHQWCIAAVPSVGWANKMYPHIPYEQAVERLWCDILIASRAMENPIAGWKEHNCELKAKCEYLNKLNIRELCYTADNGTNFKVRLIPGSAFLGGSERTIEGVKYNPNIPSEEIFITPDSTSAEGIVYSTKPLSYMGQIIDNFYIRFKNGRAVEAHAEINDELLKKILEMDKNSCRIGECALVSEDSPIATSGLLYYNTLFDENASCHLALGFGFERCIPNYEKYTREELEKIGVNNSIIHVDFMIGCDSLSIDGITDGKEIISVFRNGKWAF